MKLPRLFLILQVTDELKRMNHQDESRWPRQAATGAWSSRKCEYPSPVLYKRYQIWVISAISDGRCSNNQTSGEQGSATKHKGSVWVEELAAEDVAAAGPRVGRQFPELNPGFPSSFCGQTFLDASPSGLCELRLHLLRDTDSVLLFKPTSQQLLQRSNRKRPDWKHDWKDKKEQR